MDPFWTEFCIEPFNKGNNSAKMAKGGKERVGTRMMEPGGGEGRRGNV